MNVIAATGSARISPASLVILAGVCAALHIGKLPPALPVLRETLDISLVQAGFLLSLVQLAGMTLGLAVGLAADGWGLKRSLITGLLVLSAASVAGAWMHSVPALLVLRAVEGFGFLLVTMPAPGLIRKWVQARRLSVMLGLWGTYMPLGTALSLLTGPVVIDLLGWQGWWGLMGLLTLAMAAWAWRGIPADMTSPASLNAQQPQSAWTARLYSTLSTPGPWLVALCFAMYSSQWLAVIGFLPTIYSQTGWSAGVTAWLTAGVAGVNMLGNMASGKILQGGVLPHRLLILGFCVMGICVLGAYATWPLSAQGQGMPAGVRLACLMIFSMVGGVIPGTLFTLAVKAAPDEGTVSTTVGWMQQWSALGQFCGPPLVAWVAGRVGGWQWTWAITGASCAQGIVLSLMLARLNKKQRIDKMSRMPQPETPK